jgi:hypothetical protein
MIKIIVACGTAAAALVVPAPPAAAATSSISLVTAARPISQIPVELVTANGSGCPMDSVDADVLTFGNETFALTLSPTGSGSDFVARSGGSASAADSRRNCQYSLRITPPEGMTYAIAEADFSGTAALGQDAEAVVRTSYYFQGSSATEAVSHTFAGPRTGGWQTTDTFEAASLTWAPCGAQRNLAINSELRVSSDGTTPSQISMGPVSVFRIVWKSC